MSALRICPIAARVAAALLPAAVVCAAQAPAEEASAVEAADVRYNRDVRPILADKCFQCHGPDAAHREADLRLDLHDAATAERDGRRPIVPGRPERSEVVRRILSTDADARMPPAETNLELSAGEIETLRRWIAAGAEYEPHWAFVPPRAPPLPEVRNAPWCRNDLDRFVLAELERRSLAPSPEADPATLARRVALALTGLPPTGDPAAEPRPYEALVDELLASPHFGERLALDWLDAARYADTNGYYTDNERRAWPWRDWVIGAFNRNLPFDRFTVEQLAGDLLPNPAVEQRIATGFHRNHMVTNETGIIEEEYRVGYVVDRVDTTAATWLGLTFGCARCHDHKYDPISQREYYRLYAAFNNIEETGLIKDVAPLSPAPALMLPTSEEERQLTELAARHRAAEGKFAALRPALDREIAAWERTAVAELPPAPTAGCTAHVGFEAPAAEAGSPNVARPVGGEPLDDAGVFGRAGGFDGTRYAELVQPLPLERDRPFTLAVWILPGAGPQGCVTSKMSSDVESRGFEILWYKSQPRINLSHRYGIDGIEVVADQKFTGKQWRHLVVCYDGSSRAAGVTAYVDGRPSPLKVRRDNLSGSIATHEPWRIAWKGTGIGFEGSLDEFRLYDRALSAQEAADLHRREFVEGTLAAPREKRTRTQVDELRNYYVAAHGSAAARRTVAELRDVVAAEDAVRQGVLSVSVMREMPQPRETFVLARGQYDQPGERVTFDVPAALGALPPGAPRNRLGLAQWLVAPDHPLTARVAVNRLWAQCFGDGLVRTPNDFGLQGEPPTNAALLDHLAARFRDGAPGVAPWDQKALLRYLVTSAAFRQSSRFAPRSAAVDPENRLLARGPRFRLPAELLRDQALAVGGLLSPRLGGPSVKPYQPPGLWEAVSYNGDATYRTDQGESLYRRGLYTYWKRQSPPPAMLAFDGPTREVCTIRRPRTNTPLQALVLLNDETFVEAARGLATRTLRAVAGSPDARVRWAFRAATGRAPSDEETAPLVRLVETQQAAFRREPSRAAALLQVGESPVDARFDPGELAAWTMAASVLLNLDEVASQH